MASNDNVVEILLAYGFSKEESEKAARLATAYLDETARKQLNNWEKHWGKEAIEHIKAAKEQAAKIAEIKAVADKKAADNAIKEEKRVTAAAKKEYEVRLKAQTDAIKGVGLVAAGVAAASSGVLYKALGFAQQYIAATKENNELTQKWGAATKEINDAQLRIGKSLATAVLPALEKAADVIDQVASWMEANPEAVSAGLKGVAEIATMASIVSAISATILVAQKTAVILKAIEASKVFSSFAGRAAYGTAAAAATGGVATAGGAAASGALATIAPAVGVLIAGAFLVELERKGLNKVMGTDQSFGDIGKTAGKSFVLLVDEINRLGFASDENIVKTHIFWTELLGLLDAEEKAASGAQDLTQDLTQAADAYGQMIAANAAAVASAAQQVETVNANYDKNIEALYTSHAAAMSAISSRLAKTLATIESNYDAVVAAAAAAALASAKAHAEQEAEIKSQGAETIAQIIADSHKRLEELEKQHNRRVEGLTNSRDALALAQENRDYKDQVSEEKRRAQDAIAAAKKATAKALAELDKRYAAEQQKAKEQAAKEQAAYEAAKAAAAAASTEEFDAEQEAYNAKLTQLKDAKEEELKAIESALKKELAENKKGFIDKLNALGVYLGKETALYNKQQAKNLADMTAFVDAMIAQSGRLGDTSAPAYASGGYASGLVNTGERGREFIMTHNATRMAETMLGGSLTQGRLLAGLAGASSSVTLNDHRRFDSSLSVADRNLIRADTVKVFREMLGIQNGR